VLGLSTDYILYGAVETDSLAPIIEVLKHCPDEKISYLENIVRTFVRSCE
jgi:hypothetical protein